MEAGWSGGRRGGLGDRGQRWPGRCTWTETGPLTQGVVEAQSSGLADGLAGRCSVLKERGNTRVMPGV